MNPRKEDAKDVTTTERRIRMLILSQDRTQTINTDRTWKIWYEQTEGTAQIYAAGDYMITTLGFYKTDRAIEIFKELSRILGYGQAPEYEMPEN